MSSPRATAVAIAILSFALASYRHQTFRSSTFDLAVFEQALWKLSHFHAPFVTVIGWDAFADHLSPVLILIAPLYRIWPSPMLLFALQGVAFGAGYLAVRRLIVRSGLTSYSKGLSVAYCLSPLLWNALLYDFHPTTLAIPFIVIGYGAALRNDLRTLLLSSIAILLMRDDLGLVVAAIALTGITAPASRHRLRRVWIAIGGLGWTLAGGAVGAALGSDRHFDYHYSYLGASAADALTHPLHTIVAAAGHLITEANLSLIVTAYLLPFGALMLAAPRRLALALAPSLPLLLSTSPLFKYPGFHYGAPVWGGLFVATCAGLARSRAGPSQRLRWNLWLSGFTIGSLIATGPIATTALTRPAVNAADARAIIALIRPEDGVSATARIGPHVANRAVLFPFPYPFTKTAEGIPFSDRIKSTDPRDQASIDIVVTGLAGGIGDFEDIDWFLDSPASGQFRLVAQRGDVRLYRRIADPPG